MFPTREEAKALRQADNERTTRTPTRCEGTREECLFRCCRFIYFLVIPALRAAS